MRTGGQTEVLGNTEGPWGRQGALGVENSYAIFRIFWCLFGHRWEVDIINKQRKEKDPSISSSLLLSAVFGAPTWKRSVPNAGGPVECQRALAKASGIRVSFRHPEMIRNVLFNTTSSFLLWVSRHQAGVAYSAALYTKASAEVRRTEAWAPHVEPATRHKRQLRALTWPERPSKYCLKVRWEMAV